jgi:phosphatidylserine/phosphatidylglycerophosphate/cardiolipin synthase-like enzyme
VSPTTTRERVLRLIDGATDTIHLEAMYLRDRELTEALLAAIDRGVGVRALFNDPSFDVGDATEGARRLTDAGAEVRRRPDRFIHAKVVVADGQQALVGSANFSFHGVDRNREAGIVLGEAEPALARLMDVLEEDWTAAVPFFTAESVP